MKRSEKNISGEDSTSGRNNNVVPYDYGDKKSNTGKSSNV